MRRAVMVVLIASSIVAYAQRSTGPIELTGTTAPRGIPFSAEVVTETRPGVEEVNPNENCPGKVYRDSEGRTRVEGSANVNAEDTEPCEIVNVIITDPIERKWISFSISPNGEGIAHVHHTDSGMTEPIRPKAHSAAGRSSTAASTAVRPVPRATTRSTGVPASIGSTASTGSPHSIGSLGGRHISPHCTPSPDEDLGVETIEGYKAHGTRSKCTLSPGGQDNDEPIVLVHDIWMSPELQVVMHEERDDPRYGHKSIHLRFIDRSEPDPALFQAPPDYTVEEN